MSAMSVIEELQSLGSESIKKVLIKHGAREPFFRGQGRASQEDRETHQEGPQARARALRDRHSDAMYLAGLIADDAKMTKRDLQRWVEQAYWSMLSTYTVPWVAAGSPAGHELALEWIDSKKESIAEAGWSTLSSLVATKDDADLDIAELKKLLARVAKTIHQQPNRVRSCMNGFIIAVGSYVRH